MGRELLAQNIMRNLFSVKKITYTLAIGTVLYKSKKISLESRGGRKNFQIFTAAEFIAAIAQHIPEKSFQFVHYNDWYSNRGRGEREKQKTTLLMTVVPAKVETIDVSDSRPKKIVGIWNRRRLTPSSKWRECIMKVWEVDSLSVLNNPVFF